MMRPQVFVKSLEDADADNIALAQVPVSGAAITLNGIAVTGGVATLDSQRRILLTYGVEAGDRTLLLTGTNESGARITETLSVPNGGAGSVASEQDFYTVSRAMPAGGGWSAAMTLGTNNTGSGVWLMPTTWTGVLMMGFQGEVLSGAPTWSIETSMESPWPPLPIYQVGHDQTLPIPTPFPLAGLSAQLGDAQGSISGPPFATWRLTISAGFGSVKMTAIQAGSK